MALLCIKSFAIVQSPTKACVIDKQQHIVCRSAKVQGMKTKQAILLAGSREALAKLLGTASITTYRWKDDLPQKHEDRLRVLCPKWFKGVVKNVD